MTYYFFNTNYFMPYNQTKTLMLICSTFSEMEGILDTQKQVLLFFGLTTLESYIKLYWKVQTGNVIKGKVC